MFFTIVTLRRISGSLLCLAGLVVGILACAVAFGTASLPSALLNADSPFRNIGLADLPAIQTFKARDGHNLAFRQYGGQSDKAVVLLHGAGGASFMMHSLANAVQSAGCTAFVPDIRGHGSSGLRGDIQYVGQLGMLCINRPRTCLFG